MKFKISNLKFQIGNSWRSQAGFTMIEILIAVALIGVLGTAVVVLIDPVSQFKKGRDAERKSELSQLQTGLELYRADIGTYPPGLPDCDDPLEEGGVTYIQKAPCDPKSADGYKYNYMQLSASTYTLVACLENIHDPKKDEANDETFCTGTTDWSYTLVNP